VFSSRETAWKDDKKLTYINLTKKSSERDLATPEAK
jgi:hypothetical protein